MTDKDKVEYAPPFSRDIPETLSPVTNGNASNFEYAYPLIPVPNQGKSPGAGIDITSDTMPEDGMLEVYDTDEDLLDAERENSAAAGFGETDDLEPRENTPVLTTEDRHKLVDDAVQSEPFVHEDEDDTDEAY